MNLEGGKIITVQKAKKDSEKSTKVFFYLESYAVDKLSAAADDEGDAIRKIRWEHRGANWDVEHHCINDVDDFP